MRSIEVSEAVWQAIADQGKFGETEDDVLRRVFHLPAARTAQHEVVGSPVRRNGSTRRASLAKQRLSSYVQNTTLVLSFQGGASRSWKLPARSDKRALHAARTEAVEFARGHGATIGQVNAVKKALTDAGYHLTR